MKFPTTVLITIEQESNGNEYLQVHLGGLGDAAEVGSNTRAAFYKISEVGVVTATTRFVSKTKAAAKKGQAT